MDFIHGEKTTISTENGKLRGYYKNGIYHFLGVQYAKAERFMPPLPVDKWEGVKEATSYGHVCKLMYEENIGDDFKIPHRFWPQSEDCQNLNIWTSSIDKNSKLPVVVWLHGGGFFSGSAIEQIAYDGFNLASQEVVVVTVNHRLNLLGYCDLSRLSKKYERSVNVGLLDLVEALRWVNANIASFGGDKNNVTIFGQSGGGAKVTCLLNTPAAKGLFHKAMIMSGTLGEIMTDENRKNYDVIEKTVELLKLDNVEDIEKVDYQILADTYKKANSLLGYKGIPAFMPLRNEDFLGDPMYVGFSSFSKDIPLIVGSTFSEFNTLDAKYNRNKMTEEEMTEAIQKEYPNDWKQLITLFKKAFPNKKTIDILTYDDWAFRDASKKLVNKRIEQGCKDNYLYLFTTEMLFDDGFIPSHCCDISYFFRNTDLVASDNCGPNTKLLENEVSGRFLNFAKTGSPNLLGSIEWKKVEKDKEYNMIFDSEISVKANFDDEFLKLLQKCKGNSAKDKFKIF